MNSGRINLLEKVASVALKFMDLEGKTREIRIPSEIADVIVKDGISFDSSNLGFTSVSQSDMVALPDVNSLRYQERNGTKIAVLLCDFYWPDGKPFPGDPRGLLKSTLKSMKDEGFTFRVKPEYEFYLLDPNTLKPVDGGDYIDGHETSSTNIDWIYDAVRGEEFYIQKIHHEVGTGQYEIEPMPYDDPLKAADDFIFIKELVKKAARENGYIATFMPKPLVGEPGSGMHVHISVLKDGEFMFSPGKLNDDARGFVAGLLEHAKALSAICCPTVNSYKRLVPGYEAPVYIAWGGENRSVLVRIPAYGNLEEEKGRIEFRAGDASGNIYLMLNSLILAGMDGLKRSLEPGDELTQDLYKFSLEEILDMGLETLPVSLKEALDCLEEDTVIAGSMCEAYGYYLSLKRDEVREFERAVTDWEMKSYVDY